MIMEHVARILKELRKEAGLKQEDVAKYLDIASSTYAGYEQSRSEPSIETIRKICTFYKITSDYLIGLEI